MQCPQNFYQTPWLQTGLSTQEHKKFDMWQRVFTLYGERVELGGLATELKETERVGKEEDHESEAGLGEGHGNEAFSDEDICSAMKDLYEFEYYFRRSETTRWLGRSGGMWGDFS